MGIVSIVTYLFPLLGTFLMYGAFILHRNRLVSNSESNDGGGKIEYKNLKLEGSFVLFMFGTGVIFVTSPLLIYGSGEDKVKINNQGISFGISLINNAHADTNESPSPRYCEKGDNGWVWLGTGNYSSNKNWFATIIKGQLPDVKGGISEKLILKSKIRRNLRDDYFSDITGTWLGNLFGVKYPKLVCVLEKDTVIEVKQVTHVGRSKIWAKSFIK